MRQKTFGNISARECQCLAVRLPPDVVRKLDAMSGGKGARVLLMQTALSLTGYVLPPSKYINGQLTRREREAIILASQGLKDDEIAKQLGLTPGTVRQYMASIRSKLRQHNRADMLDEAARRGLVKAKA